MAHVRPQEFRDALLRMNDREEEFVEITREDDGVTIGDTSFNPSPSSQRANLLHGTRMETHPGESSYLLSHGSVKSASASTVQFTPMLLMTPASVRIKAECTPKDSLYMLPSTMEDSCLLVLEGEKKLDRSWMSLPPPIKGIKEIGIKDEGFYYVVIEYARPAVVWVVLIAAVVGLSSKAVVAEAMYPAAVSPVAKSIWMTFISVCGFWLLGIYEFCTTPDVTEQISALFAPQSASMLSPYILGTEEQPKFVQSSILLPAFSCLMIAFASLLHGLFSVFFLLSLKYTTLEQCVVLMNIHPVLVLMSRLDRSNVMERMGAVVVCAGVVGLFFATPSDAVAEAPILGDVLAFMVSVFMWFYLSLSQRLQEELPSSMLMSCINSGSLLCQLVFLFCFDSPEVGLSHDAFIAFIIPNLLGGLFGGFLAYGGFMLASRYLNPLIVSVHITLEPLFAVVIQMMALGVIPAPPIWGALFTLASGTIAVAVGGSRGIVEITDYEENLLLS